MADYVEENTFEFSAIETYPIQFGNGDYCDCCNEGGYSSYLIFKVKLISGKIKLNKDKIGYNNMRINQSYLIKYLISKNVAVYEMKINNLIDIFENIKIRSFIDHLEIDEFNSTNHIHHISSNYFDYADIDDIHRVGFLMNRPEDLRKENYNFSLSSDNIIKLQEEFGKFNKNI